MTNWEIFTIHDRHEACIYNIKLYKAIKNKTEIPIWKWVGHKRNNMVNKYMKGCLTVLLIKNY